MHYSKQFGEGVITFHNFLNALRIFMYKMIRIYFANCLLTYQNITIVIFFHIHSRHLRYHFYEYVLNKWMRSANK